MIIALTNLKGGVGKSTLCRNLAVYFADQGLKTCIVDTDIEQRTACDWANRRSQEKAILVDVFPMSSTDGLIRDLQTHQANGYQIILLDGVPQLEEVTTKMMLLAQILLIPITPSIDDLKSFERFLKRYESAKLVRPNIPAYLILNRFSKNSEATEMQQAIRLFKKYGIAAFDSVVSERVAHKRSSKYGLSVLEWRDSKAAGEVLVLCEELENIMRRKHEQKAIS